MLLLGLATGGEAAQNFYGGASSLTGTPALPAGTTATTQTAGDNSTKIATTAYVATAVASVSANGVGVQGEFKNLKASATGTSATVTVTADEAMVENSSNAYATLRAVSLSITGTTSGANGLDTGTLAASTWYSIWVIYNGSTTAGLLSLSATAPTLPSGYTYCALAGYIRTDGTANKYPLSFKQAGGDFQYVVASGSNVTGLPIMASGSTGSPTTPTWTAVSVSNYVPPAATRIRIGTYCNPTGGYQVAPSSSYGARASTTNPPPINAAPTSGGLMSADADFLLESTNIYLASDASSALLYCIGFRIP